LKTLFTSLKKEQQEQEKKNQQQQQEPQQQPSQQTHKQVGDEQDARTFQEKLQTLQEMFAEMSAPILTQILQQHNENIPASIDFILGQPPTDQQEGHPTEATSTAQLQEAQQPTPAPSSHEDVQAKMLAMQRELEEMRKEKERLERERELLGVSHGQVEQLQSLLEQERYVLVTTPTTNRTTNLNETFRVMIMGLSWHLQAKGTHGS
jgi:hypothetical protein